MQNPDDVLAQLTRGPAVVRALVADVPPDDLRRRPREGKWAAIQAIVAAFGRKFHHGIGCVRGNDHQIGLAG